MDLIIATGCSEVYATESDCLQGNLIIPIERRGKYAIELDCLQSHIPTHTHTHIYIYCSLFFAFVMEFSDETESKKKVLY